MSKNPSPSPHGAAVMMTHTACRIQGPQTGRVDAVMARTPDAAVTVVWGGVALRFQSAAAVSVFLEGFSAVRAAMMGVDKLSPAPAPADPAVAVATLSLSWASPTPYAVVHRQMYSETQRRTVHWVDLHMGPVTWQVMDRAGFDSALEMLREAHRVAVAVCLDGGKWRADPTRDDYQRPDTK